MTPPTSVDAAVLLVHPLQVQRVASSRLPTRHGEFVMHAYRAEGEAAEHIALVKGDVSGDEVLTRVHSECLTGDVFASLRCDCGEQLARALERIQETGRGLVIYMRGHEGRIVGAGRVLALEFTNQGKKHEAVWFSADWTFCWPVSRDCSAGDNDMVAVILGTRFGPLPIQPFCV